MTQIITSPSSISKNEHTPTLSLKAHTHLTSINHPSTSRVLGPRCLLTCLHRKEPIPELPSPIHNTAMKGMVVTTTGFEKDIKAELQMLVERMAGIYSNNFHEGVTHLVANAVGSKKYIVSIVQRFQLWSWWEFRFCFIFVYKFMWMRTVFQILYEFIQLM